MPTLDALQHIFDGGEPRNEYEKIQKIRIDAYNDARTVILDNIKIYLDGLKSVAEHCKDEHAVFALNKYINKIEDELKLKEAGSNE